MSTSRKGRDLTSVEVSTALRPFYFRVHPDKFHQYPNERMVNENSLKLLNEYLSNLINKTQKYGLMTLTFYIQENTTVDQSSNVSLPAKLKKVDISLSPKEDVQTAVIRILDKVQVSTDHLKQIKQNTTDDTQSSKNDSSPSEEVFGEMKWRYEFGFEAAQEKIRSKPIETLGKWLPSNIEHSREKQSASEPILEEILKLKIGMIEDLQVKSVVLLSDWSVSHLKGSLTSLKTLLAQYPKEAALLKNKVVVLGKMTGVGLNGEVLLNVEDVRQNWLNFIRSMHKYDEMLMLLPLLEKELSETLNGIKLVHRKFGPSILIQNYIQHLRKFIGILKDYKIRNEFPREMPNDLKNLRLVLEGDAGPLMLSPTGLFIAPSSCPAKVFIEFLVNHINEAQKLVDNYEAIKSYEVAITDEAMHLLELQSIQKDDNVTPNLMIECCRNLIKHREYLKKYFSGSHLRISHYYSVLHDGTICIPWNWKL
ncbi:T-cell activation inhibitor-like protein [Dinothrombium tinctorium]|uniref:T-cell activation inhibitor-like protein n=1 Tax=Dinothrombium tinctorium TaxID=1965070 RepID=A0A3S3QVB2_9ACAR|nr:T-cell activation inhibitor-like protein [Dinothrombium tinctorium]RWS17831.1 T-cell activation inhibitor-like protein [Dinothrombium tinctorium]RWS17840.1 T-cell activation inhibitor-like protein [Dinothrombium tinctorium]